MHQEGVVGVSKRVLVFLDDPGLGALIGLELAGTGQVVDIARSADRARELVGRHVYGVVLVDLRLCGWAKPEGEGPVFQVIAPSLPDPERRAAGPTHEESAQQQILAALDAVLCLDGPALGGCVVAKNARTLSIVRP